MKSLSKDDTRKDHVSTIAKIFCATFLVAVVVVSLSGPALDELDKWMDDIKHQLYTVVALSSIVTVSWIVWKIER